MQLLSFPARRWIPAAASVALAFHAAGAFALGSPAAKGIMLGSDVGPQEEQKVQRANGAGVWYPADEDSLRSVVDGYLAANPMVVPGKPLALIAPHAGYAFSGPVAGATYASLTGYDYERVVLLGLSHGTALRGASVLNVDVYETPLGRIPVDTDARDDLLDSRDISEHQAAHQNEHSAENQLPMLQRALGDFELIEILVGQMSDEQRTSLAESIRNLLDEETLLVVSTDFTHYGPNYGYVPFRDQVPERLRILNDQAVQEILEIDVPGWETYLINTQATICGRNPVSLLLETLQPLADVEGRRIAYATSGGLTGNYLNSVTYTGIVFWRIGDGLNQTEQSTLLDLARGIATDFFNLGTTPTLDIGRFDITPRLKSLGAAFVTLRNNHELRGCIGHVFPTWPLYLSVAANAREALLDPRFTHAPVTADEVSDVEIEVSVLTPMRRLLDPEQVQVGADGLLIVRGQNRGVLLPQIPIEEGWNREQFLEFACLKAGLPADAWRDPQTEIYRFTAQVFAEGRG